MVQIIWLRMHITSYIDLDVRFGYFHGDKKVRTTVESVHEHDNTNKLDSHPITTVTTKRNRIAQQ